MATIKPIKNFIRLFSNSCWKSALDL